ncbi:MAG: hypothetical protein OEY59_09325 [Deltaproteobacteria bacterium]|nr:hypothetical protein [Deltaproteobacteria bacterium]
MRKILLGLLVLSVFALMGCADDGEVTTNPVVAVDPLIGTWKSACEPDDAADPTGDHTIETYVFTASSLSGVMKMYGDTTCDAAAQNMTMYFDGTYTDGTSDTFTTGDNSGDTFTNIDLTITSVKVEANSAGAVTQLSQGFCGIVDWVEDVSQDVSAIMGTPAGAASGCDFIPIDVPMLSIYSLQTNNTILYLGLDSADPTVDRSTALDPTPLVKQ